jgi:uncharacterized OsmC-like protein
MAEFTVRAAAGSLRSSVRADASLPHRWTDEGVALELQFTGAHLLHLAAAGCELNDLYREAAAMGIDLTGALVTADGDFALDTWQSTGISYRIEVDSPAAPEELQRLLRTVDEVAEIPKTLRAGATVERAG